MTQTARVSFRSTGVGIDYHLAPGDVLEVTGGIETYFEHHPAKPPKGPKGPRPEVGTGNFLYRIADGGAVEWKYRYYNGTWSLLAWGRAPDLVFLRLIADLKDAHAKWLAE